MGIPQGSVLSSTLFAIAINGVTSCLPTGLSHSLYVDDFAIYYTSSRLSHIQRILNIAITRITSWASSVGFQFSPEKTKAIVFYRNRRHLHNESINLYMGDVPISFHSSVRFLGIIFDTHLNWKSHITDLKTRCNRRLNVLKKVASTRWGADRSTLLTLYRATVLAVLDYGSPIYGTASIAALRSLDPIHHLGVRLSSGAFKSSRIQSVLVESGVMPLSLHRTQVMMKSAVRLISSDSPAQKLL